MVVLVLLLLFCCCNQSESEGVIGNVPVFVVTDLSRLLGCVPPVVTKYLDYELGELCASKGKKSVWMLAQ